MSRRDTHSARQARRLRRAREEERLLAQRSDHPLVPSFQTRSDDVRLDLVVVPGPVPFDSSAPGAPPLRDLVLAATLSSRVVED